MQSKVCVFGEKGQKIVARMCFAKHIRVYFGDIWVWTWAWHAECLIFVQPEENWTCFNHPVDYARSFLKYPFYLKLIPWVLFGLARRENIVRHLGSVPNTKIHQDRVSVQTFWLCPKAFLFCTSTAHNFDLMASVHSFLPTFLPLSITWRASSGLVTRTEMLCSLCTL